jgi:hypothetical protein
MDYLVRVKFFANLGEHDTKEVCKQVITELGNYVEIPDVSAEAKEHGIDKVDFITIEVFARLH